MVGCRNSTAAATSCGYAANVRRTSQLLMGTVFRSTATKPMPLRSVSLCSTRPFPSNDREYTPAASAAAIFSCDAT